MGLGWLRTGQCTADAPTRAHDGHAVLRLRELTCEHSRDARAQSPLGGGQAGRRAEAEGGEGGGTDRRWQWQWRDIVQGADGVATISLVGRRSWLREKAGGGGGRWRVVRSAM